MPESAQAVPDMTEAYRSSSVFGCNHLAAGRGTGERRSLTELRVRQDGSREPNRRAALCYRVALRPDLAKDDSPLHHCEKRRLGRAEQLGVVFDGDRARWLPVRDHALEDLVEMHLRPISNHALDLADVWHSP